MKPADDKVSREVRTYLPFTFPVDPSLIETMTDFSISNALATSLVEHDDDKGITGGIAESWKIVGPKVFRFTLQKNVRWSDESTITANEVKRSLDRSLRLHTHDMQGIIQFIESVEVHSEREVDIKLSVPALDSQLPEKLTKSQFGIVKLRENGSPNLSITTGAFTLHPSSNHEELILMQNPEWVDHDPSLATPKRIVIRRPPHDMDAHSVLLSDRWPNLIEGLSITPSQIAQKTQAEGYTVWHSPPNHFLHIQLGKKLATQEGRALIRFLSKKVEGSQIGAGLTGYANANQIFPRGYPLYQQSLACGTKQDAELPQRFSKQPLKVLYSPTRIQPQLKENLESFITKVTGVHPIFISAPLNEIHKRMLQGGFDLYAGTIGIADPSPEQALSFYFDGKTPLIFPKGNSYLQRLNELRKEKDSARKLVQLGKVLSDVVCEGHFVPIFHVATVVVAKPDVDLSHFSESDESVTFSSIRFKEKP